MKLEDIIPQPATFTLKQTGKTYTLRPISLDDEIWLHREFGADIQNIFAQGRMKEISRIVFHQLVDEDKEDFLQKKVTYVNEEGVKISEMKKGGSDLLNAVIIGQSEKLEVIKALVKTLGVSRGEEDTEKKSIELTVPKI